MNETTKISVRAWDADGNLSEPAELILIEDKEAPTAPQGLKLDKQTENDITISWQASTDNVGVTGYMISYGTSQNVLVTVPSEVHSYTLKNLSSKASHQILVVALDAAGNKSSPSVITVKEDTVAPSAPQVVNAVKKYDGSIRILTPRDVDLVKGREGLSFFRADKNPIPVNTNIAVTSMARLNTISNWYAKEDNVTTGHVTLVTSKRSEMYKWGAYRNINDLNWDNYYYLTNTLKGFVKFVPKSANK
nr:fibronectin type III domain-containing protein [Paenibacillus dendrobii]